MRGRRGAARGAAGSRRVGRWPAVALALGLLAAACGSEAQPHAAADPRPTIATETQPAAWSVRPSIDQVSITGAAAGVGLGLFDATGHEVQRGTTDALGSYVFRQVHEGR